MKVGRASSLSSWREVVRAVDDLCVTVVHLHQNAFLHHGDYVHSATIDEATALVQIAWRA